MGPFIALTVNGFREARRNRVTVVAGIFGLGLLITSTLLTNVSLTTFDRVLTDAGIGIMSLMLVALSVFLSSGLLSREIERKTLFLIVSKPISRATFLLARFAGNMLTLLVLLVAMGLLFIGLIALYGTAITTAQMTAVSMLFFELLVINAVGFLMSSFTSQVVSAMVTLSVYVSGHLGGDIYALAEKAETESLKWLAKGVYYALPNLNRLNFRPQATYAVHTPVEVLLPDMAYAFAYTAALLTVAVVLFSRRDFR